MVRILGLLFLAATLAAALDLTNAVVVAPELQGREKKALELLLDEVEVRTQVRWDVAASAEDGPHVRIANGRSGAAEGYTLSVSGAGVTITGNDERGVLFGVGRLLREMRMETRSVTIADDLSIETAPEYPLRGHQLGYRPKTNSYDGWTLAMWEQYIRDLAVFGTNAIELIPPRSDDAADSPHFPLPQIEMMEGVSRICDELGLDVWIWYPALDKDYENPATVEFALKEWAEVFKRLPRIDAVFVPGGDPGHTHPEHLMPLLEKQTASLRRFHPGAEMWIAPQGFNQEWLEFFYGQLREEPEWLSGIVFGPWVRMSLAQLRREVPQRYLIRHYPDITHCLRSQYFVPDWDWAYAQTQHREPINPRPVDQAAIFRATQPYTVGFITYSEGCNDDVNKIVWSGLGWNPETEVVQILREYGRYFLGPRYADAWAQGMFALENNWRGPLLTNGGVETALRQFQTMERDAAPRERSKWRSQQGLYRAYYDAYNRERLIYETALESRALDTLRSAPRIGSDQAITAAERVLRGTELEPVAGDIRARVFELAEALFQSVRMQLSVERYQAIAIGRGANLDRIDYPLNNAPWLQHRFAEIRQLEDEDDRLAAIAGIVDWTNPGPGGFYDDLGNLTQQPHLLRGPGYPADPAFLESPYVGFARNPSDQDGPLRTSWQRFAGALNEATLSMRYEGLDAEATYAVRITYGGDPGPTALLLKADDEWEVHAARQKGYPMRPVEFPIPPAATADGAVTLRWEKAQGGGGPGRGLEIAEVWLVRK
jgi:glycosyl hydrolase family 20